MSSIDDDRRADRELLAQPSRQSPIAVVFIAWRFIRSLGFVQIAVALAFIFSGRLPLLGLLAGVGAAFVGLALMLLAWWRFVFSIQGDELVVAKGVIAVERLTIPLDRVQSVSIDQKFLHRPVGLVSVKVDTAGSSEAEFEIDAVARPVAEALQRLVAGSRAGATDGRAGSGVVDAAGAPVDPAAPWDGVGPGLGPNDGPDSGPNSGPTYGAAEIEIEEVVHRTPIELVRIGLTRLPWAGLVALAPLGAVLNDVLDFESVSVFPEFGERLGDGTLTDSLPGLTLVIVGFVLVGITIAGIVGLILQVAQSLLSDWDLTLLRTDTGFRRTAGLLNTTSKASTLTRIQAVRTEQTPAQRWLGIRSANLPTIGEGDLTIPGTTDDELDRIREIVFGPEAGPMPLDRGISPLWVFVGTRNAAVGAAALAFGLWFVIGWWSVGILGFIPIEWLMLRRQWRLRRWGISDDRLAESLRFVTLRTAEQDLIKAQTVTVEQSFFERRRGLATVRIELAEGHLAVPFIDLADAEAARDRVLFAVESNRRPWM